VPSLVATVKDKLFVGLNAAHRGLLRASGGRIGGQLMGMAAVRLVTTGRKSGEPREVMLTAPIVDGDRVVLVASYGGDPRHPAWFLNLRADPEVQVGLRGGPLRPMRARVATPEEKAELWPRITSVYKGYASYQRRTDREIPVVLLDPADGG
jgi:deazaflavin-dependent oxidoreductase (nitroreductase family)